MNDPVLQDLRVYEAEQVEFELTAANKAMRVSAILHRMITEDDPSQVIFDWIADPSALLEEIIIAWRTSNPSTSYFAVRRVLQRALESAAEFQDDQQPLL